MNSIKNLNDALDEAEGPEILWMENFEFSYPTFKSEIWIPVRKKI